MKTLFFMFALSLPAFADLTYSVSFHCGSEGDMDAFHYIKHDGRPGHAVVTTREGTVCLGRVRLAGHADRVMSCPLPSSSQQQQQCQLGSGHNYRGYETEINLDVCGQSVNEILERTFPGQNCRFTQVSLKQ